MNRTEALCVALGKQGTTQEMSDETGVPVIFLLYGKTIKKSPNSDYSKGYHAVRTNPVEFNKINIFPKMKGNVDFWLGIADGLMVSVNITKAIRRQSGVVEI